MQVTEDDIETYTNGHCWSLAWQISKRTGLPLVTISPESQAWNKHRSWDHVVVQVGNKYLDVEGLVSKRELQDKWGRYLTKHGTFSSMEEYEDHLCDKYGFSDYDDHVQHTINLAKFLIGEYIGTP
jgi:hypothetical protein